MSLPPLMQKGLSALLKVIKFTDPSSINQAVTTLEQHFTLSAYEIALAYQKSYKSGLNAIIAGLGKASIFDAKVIEEFAINIVPDYLQPFALQQGIQAYLPLQQFCSRTIAKCDVLIEHKTLLFQGEENQLTEADLAALITDTDSLSITALVLEQLQSLKATHPDLLDEELLAFFRFNDLLGNAILFFLHEQLRRDSRVEATLAALQRQDLWQDVREIKASLKQLMTRFDLSKQIKARDELTYHNSDSLSLINQATVKLKRLHLNNPQLSQLVIMGGSVLSSAGALPEAENLLREAQAMTLNEADRALAAFNLFQVRLRNQAFEEALMALQEAINIDQQGYALHDVEKYPIERILGAGGMGCVFLCQHKLRKQRVVVKCFWEDCQGTVEDVFKEAFAMSEIAGEYVPMPLDYGYVDPVKQERAFFVTEYIEGTIDGETWLAKRGELRLAEGLQVGLQIAKGLQVAHAAGILHLDLKPANVLLKKMAHISQTSEMAVKIIDFGLAQVAKPLQQALITRQTQNKLSLFGQAVFGTLDYAAPEQQGFEQYGLPSVKSDVFAFGTTLYRLLTNERPRKLNPRRLAEAPALFDLLCDCVEDEPHRRPSIPELINQLEGLDKQISTQNVCVEKPSQVEALESKDELEQLLELARHKYEQNPLSYFSSTRFSDDEELITEVNVVCPYCDYIFPTTEGGVECPKCHWDFEIDDDGDVISSYEDDQ